MDSNNIESSSFNRAAWDKEVDKGGIWTQPVSPKIIRDARNGVWDIVLTPTKPVPKNWFPELRECRVLCLASGGGQQGPIFAAAGARVTVFDNSPRQLQQDEYVARRDGLQISTHLGDMRDLKIYADGSFDLVVHPVSNVFVESIQPVWEESFRVLRPGGVLMSGFCNPIRFIFDQEKYESGELAVKNKIPYSDLDNISENITIEQREYSQSPLLFGHSLQSQIGGQIQAGFLINGFYEDNFGMLEPLDSFIDSYIATRAIKP